MVEQLGTSEHAARVEHEVAQQPELGRRQLDELAAAADLVGVLVEGEIGEREDRVHRRRPGAAKYGADPRGQFLQTERLRYVVVAADGEPGDFVLRGVPRGQEDHRDAVLVPAEPADDLETVDVGQQHVQDDQVEGMIPGQAQRIRPVLRRGHAEPEETQRCRDGLPEELLVVGHEQLAAVGAPAHHHRFIPAPRDERYV